METITISLTEQQAQKLKDAAAHYRTTPEALALRGIEELLERPADEVAQILKVDAILDDLFRERESVYRALAEGAQ